MEAGVRLAQLPDGAARPLLAHSHVRALSTASGSYSSSNTSQENWPCTFSFKIAFVNCVQNFPKHFLPFLLILCEVHELK